MICHKFYFFLKSTKINLILSNASLCRLANKELYSYLLLKVYSVAETNIKMDCHIAHLSETICRVFEASVHPNQSGEKLFRLILLSFSDLVLWMDVELNHK